MSISRCVISSTSLRTLPRLPLDHSHPPPSPSHLLASTSTLLSRPTPSSLRNRTRFFSSSSTSAAPMAANMLQANRLKQAFLRSDGPSMGLWQMLPGSNISRALARTPGIDWVMVDCEHGQMNDTTMHEAVPAIAAEGVSPIVRIPDFQPWMVKRALDSGAHGVLVPLIRTVDEVKTLVEACKFPPQGKRGFGSPFSMQNFQRQAAGGPLAPAPTFTEYLEQANASLLTMVQIETREALEAVEAIAPLVDVLFIGPFDLGNNIGHPILNGVMRPELEAAMARILAAANVAGVRCGVYSTGAEQARMYAEQGFHMISVATDITALQAVMGDSVAVALGKAKPEKAGSY